MSSHRYFVCLLLGAKGALGGGGGLGAGVAGVEQLGAAPVHGVQAVRLGLVLAYVALLPT